MVREEQGEERHDRDDEQRDLGARGDRDLAREPHLPVARDDDRAAVLGRVADDRHDHDRDEELAQADSCCERAERVDEDLAHPGCGAGRHGERGERGRQRPRSFAWLLALARLLPVEAQVPADDGEIEQQEHDRHRHRGDDDRVPLGRSRVAERGREREGDDRGCRRARSEEQRAAVDPCAVGAGELRDSVHEQEIRDHAPRERAENDHRQVGADGEERDDQLRRVPEARVEETADPRARVLRRVLGRFADQPREGDERERSEHEERDVAGAGEPVDRDRDGREEQRPHRSFRAIRQA